jgi:hypothetical protein
MRADLLLWLEHGFGFTITRLNQNSSQNSGQRPVSREGYGLGSYGMLLYLKKKLS